MLFRSFRVLWDARKEVVYPSMAVVTRRKYIQEDRDTVMRMVKSHVEGIHFLKTNKEFSLKVLAKHLRTQDRDLLEGSYQIYKADFISVPYPITQGLQATYDYVANTRPEIRSPQPPRIIMMAVSLSPLKVSMPGAMIKRSALSSIRDTYRCCFSLSGPVNPSSRFCKNPLIEVNGVLSSC